MVGVSCDDHSQVRIGPTQVTSLAVSWAALMLGEPKRKPLDPILQAADPSLILLTASSWDTALARSAMFAAGGESVID